MEELELTLPSGLRLSVRRLGRGEPVAVDRYRGERFSHGRLYHALASERLLIEAPGGERVLSASDLDALPLPDFHALRDAAQRVGAVAPEGGPLLCRNCDAPLAEASRGAPPVDLEHWYVEDLPADDAGPVMLSPRGPRVTMATTTAAEARAFHRAVLREPFRLTGAVVRAMGITAIAGLTDVDEMSAALDALPDPQWDALLAAYEAVAYSPKSYFPVVCGECGALHDAPAPPDRETDGAFEELGDLDGLRGPDDGGEVDRPGPFPDEDAFAALALEIGADVYREMGVRNIELEVVGGVADVDGSGEPLLGSYQPGAPVDAAGVSRPVFLIRIYYRTFARMYEDGPYDVQEELRETIEHEVEHHLHYLEGFDPMDDAEREEAMAELERTYGSRAFRRARAADAAAFAKGLGWLLAGTLLVLGTMVVFLHLTGRL